MNKKESLINLFIESIQDSFVSEFDKIDQSRILINEYMKEIDFNYEYDYNTFCIEFLDTSKKILNNLTEEEITNVNINNLIYESFSFMVKNKIFNSAKTINDKQKLIILHELKRYLMSKNE